MTLAKIALVAGVPAAVVVAVGEWLLLQAATGTPPSPWNLVTGGTAGAVVAVAVTVGFYRARVDRAVMDIAQLERTKVSTAEFAMLNQKLDNVADDVGRLVGHLLSDK